MPEGGDRLLLLVRFPADGALLAIRKAAPRAGRRFPRDKFGRMPEGGDRLLLLERFPADGTLLAVREARRGTGRRFSGDRFGRAPVEPHARRTFLFCG